jgi:Fe2+ or Zn2+ uptake regulation protein
VRDDIHAMVARLLEREEQRYTPVRRSLVTALLAAGRPLTAAEVRAAASDVPQSSVYRNLADLEQAGAVVRVAAADEFTRFELAEGLTDHHHHHLLCRGCGKVVDFELPRAVEQSVSRAVLAAAEREGFRSEAHRVDLVGRCPACR